MKRAVRRQLWLLIVVVALLAAAWSQLRSDQQDAPGTLLPIKPDAITRVDLQVGQAPAEHYVKHDEHWWRVDQTTSTRADDLRLGELVRIAAAPVQNWTPVDSYDPAKIGLMPPQAKLDLDGQTLLFGGMTAIGQNAYVQVGQRVGIVSLRYMPRSAQSQNIKAE
ncbi:hypothetical protein ACFFJT_15160 [Dyella flava]|uniref:DUF4340 domain-containing protein n=1 Tax=Dyella flava TaxID=1920170 RepID=A0ABS2K5I0_9GAMM|nr:hypothetical protein [Dyella flava]MBM7125558.1 hypothetical protein [Dyella flava]GLQ51580.1 hypothetical protein GCM10010872_30290 [Dyella flava]